MKFSIFTCSDDKGNNLEYISVKNKQLNTRLYHAKKYGILAVNDVDCSHTKCMQYRIQSSKKPCYLEIKRNPISVLYTTEIIKCNYFVSVRHGTIGKVGAITHY
jgi:hypothetical protein